MSGEFFRTRARMPRVSVHRFLSFVKFLAALISATGLGVAWAEPPPLTEGEAVRGALSRPAYREAETSRVVQAEIAVTEAGLLPNPVLDIARDRIGVVGGDTTERTAQLSQTFDFSGRRALRREAATQRLDAARLDGKDRRLTTIAEVRRVFAETLHRDRVQGALGQWLARIEAATLVAAQLAKAGEVSGYERRRFQREAQTARARLSGVQADAARNREKLAALTGKRPEEARHLAGELLPGALPALEAALAGLRRRPDLASLVAQAEAFERERQAAERAWIPDLTLSVGQKRIEEPAHSGNGVILGVSFSIPLFDRGQASQQRSRARAQAIRADHALALDKAEAELRGVWRQADELRKAAEAFRGDSLAGFRDLSRIAEAAYRAGEATLLELLDAYRTELDSAITELDLELRARIARIEFDSLSGVSSYE